MKKRISKPKKDLTGQRFGRLTVLGLSEKRSPSGRMQWHCICDCGNERNILTNALNSGQTVSCGCYARERQSHNYRDLTGQRFGRLTVIKDAGRDKNKLVLWLCLCDCGKEVVVKGTSLTRGNTKSCGCYHEEKKAEILAKAQKARKYDNHTKERLYKVWNSMKSRCYVKSDHRYEDWGGRGITVCDDWRYSYQTFKKWAIENGYDSTAKRGKCTIDRIDNNGNYEPSNCRFVDMKTQANNRRPYVRKKVHVNGTCA